MYDVQCRNIEDDVKKAESEPGTILHLCMMYDWLTDRKQSKVPVLFTCLVSGHLYSTFLRST